MRVFANPALVSGYVCVGFLCLPCCIWFRCKWFCINVTYRWYASRQWRRHWIIAVHYSITIRIFHWFHRHCDDAFFLLASFMQCECSIENVPRINHTNTHTLSWRTANALRCTRIKRANWFTLFCSVRGVFFCLFVLLSSSCGLRRSFYSLISF